MDIEALLPVLSAAISGKPSVKRLTASAIQALVEELPVKVDQAVIESATSDYLCDLLNAEVRLVARLTNKQIVWDALGVLTQKENTDEYSNKF